MCMCVCGVCVCACVRVCMYIMYMYNSIVGGDQLSCHSVPALWAGREIKLITT